MERALEKIAKQLNAYDEASLMQLWHKYAVQVSTFEPSRRWEEAAIILSLIQGVRWKNQLFNYHLAMDSEKNMPQPDASFTPFMTYPATHPQEQTERQQPEHAASRATILSFPKKRSDQE